MEIGDTIDTDTETQTETEPRRRKRSVRSARSSNEGARTETSAQKGATRRKNGSDGASRQRNDNGRASDPQVRTELQALLVGLRDLRDGEFDVRIGGSSDPLMADLAEAFNGIAERNERLASEVVRLSTTIGREGQMNERASISRAKGAG